MGYSEQITIAEEKSEGVIGPEAEPWYYMDPPPLRATAPLEHPPIHEQDYIQERDYAEILRIMQEGQWQRAVPMLRALQAQHPTVGQVEALLQEATFHADIESHWAGRVKERQHLRLPLRLRLSVLAVIALGVVLIGGLLYYQFGQRAHAQLADQATMVQHAQSALAAGQYDVALELFEQLLVTNPTNPAARQGREEALQQRRLATDYQLALDYIAAGNSQQALNLLTKIQIRAPGYRDVDKRLADLKSTIGTPELFAEAEAAFTHGLWVTAITSYEQLRRLDGNYEAAMTTAHLATAYFRAGQQMVAVRPTDSEAIKQAQLYFKKATQLQAKDADLKTESQWLETYLTGERLLIQNRYEPAIQALYPLYQARPTYLGGYVADQDLPSALVVYQRAIQIGLDSNNLLAQRITALEQLLTPTPTPIPTATAIPAPVIVEPVVSAPVPVSTPTPTAPSYDQYRGWIAFRSSRNGGEAIFLMRADGSEVQLAPAVVADKVGEHYQQQQMSSDGSQTLYPAQPANQGSINLFKATTGATATEGIMLTNYNGTEYDPVWSPDDGWIAFVANHTGNDEIWRMDPNGGQQQQLTFNDWQWDKHPSFSPDGQQLVFYSNRTGLRQIWRMAADGANQQNLSNNTFEDWDPIWLR